MFRLKRVLVRLLLLLINQTSVAGTATGTLPVTANVADTCTVAATGNLLAFGAYTGAVNNASGTLSLTCTDGDTYTVALSAGSGTGASFTNRVLTNSSPAGTLNYNIYTTNARTTVWGNGTGATATVPGTGTGATQTLTAYGQIPAAQTATVTPGNYTDTVTITVTFSP